jgi:hypothetical protein
MAPFSSPAGFHRGDAECSGQVAFAGAWWAEKVHHLRTSDEVELCERHDAIAIQGRLKREVEAFERLWAASTWQSTWRRRSGDSRGC